MIVVLSAPPVLSLATTRLGRSAKMPGFARASGISGTMPKFGEAAALVGHLRSQLPAEGKLLVVANEQMLYFLAGRPSILEKEEYLLYLVGAGLVADADARTLVPATRIIERLEGERPLVVDYAGSPGGRNFREVYPEVAAYLDQHYRVVQTFGKYRLLEWSANVEHNEG